MQGIGLLLFLTTFFLGVISGIYVSVTVWFGVYLLSLGALLFVFGIRNSCVASKICALGILGLGLALVRIAGIPEHLPPPFVPLIDTKVLLTGTVIALPDIRETSTRITVTVERDGEQTRILAAAPSYPPVHVGDHVRISGTLTLPEPFEGEGGRMFQYDDYLRKEGVYALIQPARVEVLGRDADRWLRFLRLLEGARNGFMYAVAGAIPEPESALAVGLIAGGKQGLGEELIEAFTVAGLLQIVVLSGYNVMVIAGGIQRALGFLPTRIGAILACVSIICFVLAAGGGSPALRAGLMALLCILARAFGAPYEVLRTLFFTLFLLVLWNPLLLPFDPGLQFSFLATLGLILGTPLVASWMTAIRNDTFRELLASSLAAQVGVLPILLWQTGNLSLVAIAANIIVTPIIPIAMAASAVAAGMSMVFGSIFPLISLILGIPAYISLALIIQVARISAALPFAQITLPAFGFWVVPSVYALLGVATWRGYAKRPLPETSGRFESLY